MGYRWLFRVAAVVSAVPLALAPAATASAHDVPADGFNAVLLAGQHGLLATDSKVSDCAAVRGNAPDLIGAGKDVWVFDAPQGGQFDTAASEPTVQLVFLDPADELEVDLTIPSDTYPTWFGPEGDQHLAAVAVPTGWQLLDGDAKIVDASTESSTETSEETQRFAVIHTCVNGVSPTTAAPTAPSGGGGGLPLTGTAIGGIVVLGCGLLAAGVALMAVRRRREIDLTEL